MPSMVYIKKACALKTSWPETSEENLNTTDTRNLEHQMDFCCHWILIEMSDISLTCDAGCRPSYQRQWLLLLSQKELWWKEARCIVGHSKLTPWLTSFPIFLLLLRRLRFYCWSSLPPIEDRSKMFSFLFLSWASIPMLLLLFFFSNYKLSTFYADKNLSWPLYPLSIASCILLILKFLPSTILLSDQIIVLLKCTAHSGIVLHVCVSGGRAVHRLMQV